jgi:hypothetical protein
MDTYKSLKYAFIQCLIVKICIKNSERNFEAGNKSAESSRRRQAACIESERKDMRCIMGSREGSLKETRRKQYTIVGNSVLYSKCYGFFNKLCLVLEHTISCKVEASFRLASYLFLHPT